jgi:hypothetical protein
MCEVLSTRFRVVAALCCLAAGVAAAGVPPDDPPKGGGEPYCEEELLQCITDRDQFEDLWTECSDSYATCLDEKEICLAENATLSADLDICTADLDACDDDLQECGEELTVVGDLFDECILQLASCESSSVTFPATGQVTCWDESGLSVPCSPEDPQDGFWQAGGDLDFIWNDDGTLTDANTHLLWERLDESGGIHDHRTGYLWADGFDVKIFSLNNTCKSDETVDCSENGDADCEAVLGSGEVCGFAGYRDWRMPNVKEALSILTFDIGPDYQWPESWYPEFFRSPCSEGCSAIGPVSTACSCRGLGWTSTTWGLNPAYAFHMTGLFGLVPTYPRAESDPMIPDIRKDNSALTVRGVRGP